METISANTSYRYPPLPGGSVSGIQVPNLSDANDSKREKLEKAASGFEQMMLTMMMKEMNKTVHKTGLFHGGNAEEIYSDLFTFTVAEKAAEKSPLGLKNVLMRQLDKIYTENDNAIGKNRSSWNSEKPILHCEG